MALLGPRLGVFARAVFRDSRGPKRLVACGASLTSVGMRGQAKTHRAHAATGPWPAPQVARLLGLVAPVFFFACATTTPESLGAESGARGVILLGRVQHAGGRIDEVSAGFTAALGYCLQAEHGLAVSAGPERLRALWSAGAPNAERADEKEFEVARLLSQASLVLDGELREPGPDAQLRLELRTSGKRARSEWIPLSGLHLGEFCRQARAFVGPAGAKDPEGPGKVAAAPGTQARETGSDAVRLAEVIDGWGRAALLEAEGRPDQARQGFRKLQERAPGFVFFPLETFRLHRFEYPDRYRRLLQKERARLDAGLSTMRGLKNRPAAARAAAHTLVVTAWEVSPLRPELSIEFARLAAALDPRFATWVAPVRLMAALQQSGGSPSAELLAAAKSTGPGHGLAELELVLAAAGGMSRSAAGDRSGLSTLVERASEMVPPAPSYHRDVLDYLRLLTRPDAESFRSFAQRLRARGLFQTRLHVAATANAEILAQVAPPVFSELRVRARLLGLEDDSLHAKMLYALAQSQVRAGEPRSASSSFRAAEQIFRKLGLPQEAALARARSKQTLLCEGIVPLPVQIRRPGGFAPDEERVLASYTGLYNYASHDPDVQARTYGGRQADTNVFLKELLDRKRTEDAGLTLLRQAILPEGADTKGAQVLFVDIGPAVANRWEPAVTAESVARDFPSMAVVALDLPEQVRRFQRYVPRKLQRGLFAKTNFRILSADGIRSLREQFAAKTNWLPEDRAILTPPEGQLVVVRSANAIDIYLPYGAVRGSLERMASDFSGHSLLYFFNRSILFKPKGSREFRIVGFVSVRGFHHNKVTFSREGDPAFSLSSSAIEHALQMVGR